MKKLILFLLATFTLLSASALSVDEETTVCNRLFFFLVESGGDYTPLDLENLRAEIPINLSIEEVSNYAENYTELCESLIGRSLPYNNVVFSIDSGFPDCETDLAYEFFGYNLDWSLPFFKVYFGKLTCESVDNFKWIFNLRNEGEEIYILTGIKFWAIFFVLFAVFILWFIFSNMKVNRMIRNFPDSETPIDKFINEEEQIGSIEK